jgi:regulatory protein
MAGTVTELRFQKRNSDRVNVYLDHKFAFGLAAIVAAKLRVGQSLSDADFARLGGQDEIEQAYERALNYLSYRPRSETEVRRNLSKKGIDEEVIDVVLSRLARASLVDDVSFARYWVDNRMQFRPRGSRALRYELRQRGISDEIIDEVTRDLDEEKAARQVATSGARRYLGLPSAELRRKLGAYLARRGFSYGIIKPLVEEFSRATEDGALPGENDW